MASPPGIRTLHRHPVRLREQLDGAAERFARITKPALPESQLQRAPVRSVAMTPRLEWMHNGTQLFLDAVDRLSDSELDAQSPLEGWQRRHVIGHVARNAEALGRLLDWA